MILSGKNQPEPTQAKTRISKMMMNSNNNRYCEHHGNYTPATRPHYKPGKVIYLGCPQCLAEKEAMIKKQRDELDKKIQRKQMLKLRKESGIPVKFLEKKFSDYEYSMLGDDKKYNAVRTAAAYTKNFRKHRHKGASLIFSGFPGTGKTHLACAICSGVMDMGLIARYTTAFDAISLVMSCYNKNSKQRERGIYEMFQKPALLVIDEVGVQRGKPEDKLIFYQIINGRYSNNKPTIMISNFVEADLEDFVGIRCMDRFYENGGVVVAFDWDSWRRK